MLIQRKVALMGLNASGAADVVCAQIECTQQQYDDGDHYEMAKHVQEAKGLDVRLVADEADPAYEVLRRSASAQRDDLHGQYRDFFRRMLVTTQDAWLEAREHAPQMHDQVVDVLKSAVLALDARQENIFYFGVSTSLAGPGYICRSGHAVNDAGQLNFMAQRGDISVMPNVCVYPVKLSDMLQSPRWPLFDDLISAAEDAVERAKQYGFKISPQNQVEVLQESLALHGGDLPGCLRQLVPSVFAMAKEMSVQDQVSASRPRNG